MKLAKHYGIQIIEPVSGHLACGDAGMGKLADLETLKAAIDRCLNSSDELAGKKVIITAGATIEAIDLYVLSRIIPQARWAVRWHVRHSAWVLM